MKYDYEQYLTDLESQESAVEPGEPVNSLSMEMPTPPPQREIAGEVDNSMSGDGEHTASEVAEFIKYKALTGDDKAALEKVREKQNERLKSANLAQAFGDFGASLAGQKVDGEYYDAIRKQSGDEIKGAETDIERNRKLVQDFMGNKRAETIARENREMRREDLTERRADRAENRALRLDEKERDREEKRALLENKLTTPFGLARTEDDAKKLKDAGEMKDKFDRSLQEMIDLRKKHGGGAIWDREDVGRGKQLSKDLLLTYKDLSKLGVLSKADEAILNAIIPPDPLAFDFVPGQDPILHKLEKFKGDSQTDFETRLKTRLQGEPTAGVAPPETKKVNGVTWKKVKGGWEKVS